MTGQDFMTRNKQLLIYLFLALITLAAYGQVGGHGFLNLDDQTYVAANHYISDGITAQGLLWAFTTGYASNWHPLTWVSHMLDIQIFGLNPLWHHLGNLLFHVANVLLLFFVLHRMTNAPWKSAFVAALFSLHPLHVESVAWVAEKKDVLSTFFWMLTLIAYVRYARQPRSGSYMAVVAFFVLGLMAKPMLVTLPFVLLLLDFWPLGRLSPAQPARESRKKPIGPVSTRANKGKTGKSPRNTIAGNEYTLGNGLQWASIRPLILEKLPLLGLSTISCIVTYIAQTRSGLPAKIGAFSPGVRIANALVSYVIYIEKMILPVDLAVLYPHPASLPLWQVLGAALFLVAVTLAVVATAKRFPYLAVGWPWFTGSLVPVIGLVQVGAQAMADRYTYIPSIGLFLMAAWGIPEILGKRSRSAKGLPHLRRCTSCASSP